MNWAVVFVNFDESGIHYLDCVRLFNDANSAKKFITEEKYNLGVKSLELCNYNNNYVDAIDVPEVGTDNDRWLEFIKTYCFCRTFFVTPSEFKKRIRESLSRGSLVSYALEKKREDYNPPNFISRANDYYIMEIKDSTNERVSHS